MPRGFYGELFRAAEPSGSSRIILERRAAAYNSAGVSWTSDDRSRSQVEPTSPGRLAVARHALPTSKFLTFLLYSADGTFKKLKKIKLPDFQFFGFSRFARFLPGFPDFCYL
jgi:hypothetical protein